MFKTLYSKLALSLFLVLVIIGFVFALVSSITNRTHMQELVQLLNADLAKNLVAERNLVTNGQINHQAIVKTFSQFMSINPSIEIYLIDLAGNIKSYSADPGKIKRTKVSLKPIKQFLDRATEFPLLGDDPRSLTRKKAFSVTAIPSKEKPQGYLYVVLRGEQFDFVERAIGDSHILRLSLWAVAISLMVGLLSGLVVFRALTWRLNSLSGMISTFGQTGHSAADLGEIEKLRGSGDEVDKLSGAFLKMVSRISDQIEQLEEKDRLRRNLIAQTWHDLRTPLTSMQGYIESLRIKSTSLSDAEKDKFIDIALRQGHRLSEMLEELIVLASLDAQEPIPDIEKFALVELIYDVVQKHQVKAGEKKISMTVAAAPDLPVVLGKVDMTERILDNLLGNALSLTPKGGHIDLALQEDNEWLSVSISDNGPGIDKKDLPHIFEPFYQGDTAKAQRVIADEGANSYGSGLGLAIAERLIKLQSGEISVRSKAGHGSEFTFKLRLSAASHA